MELVLVTFSVAHVSYLFHISVMIVGSVKVNFFSYLYRVDKSTIFGMRGLWGLTINSGRGATLKYLQDSPKSKKKKNGRLFRQKSDYLSFYTT